MKIYFIGQKGIPAKLGGVEHHVEELSVRLAQAGHEVYVYVRPNYTSDGLKEYKGVRLLSLPSIATKHLDAITHTFRATIDVLKKDADIIHYHSIGPSSLLWIIKLFKPRVPVISTFHSKCYTHKKWGRLARACLRFGEMVSCLIADETITVSQSLAKYARKRYGKETVYIPNGAPVAEKASARKIKKWGLEKDNYILNVSRFVKHKGIHHLIRAYNRVKTDKKLVITGEGFFSGDYARELETLANGNKNIIFTGPQTGRMLRELFSNACLFVQPSESEGLSITLLEAMSYEKAVLVSDIPENLEAVGRTGFFFKNKNADGLAEKLNYILGHSEEVATREILGKERVDKFYNWEDISRLTINLYGRAIKEKESNATKTRIKLVKKLVHFLF